MRTEYEQPSIEERGGRMVIGMRFLKMWVLFGLAAFFWEASGPFALADRPVAEHLVHSERELAASLIDAVMAAYKRNLPSDIEALVSDDFLPNKYDFSSQLAESGRNLGYFAFAYSIDRTFLKDERLVVDIHWQRKTIIKGSAAQQNDTGSASFEFVQAPDQKWRLIKVGGQSPF